MGFLGKIDTYIGTHVWILTIILALALIFTIILFTIALVHTLRGTRNPLTIALSVAMLTDCVLYSFYVYFYFWKDKQSYLMLYFTYIIFVIQHWVLAHRYFASSILVPRMISHKKVSSKTQLSLSILLWAGIVLLAASSLFIVFEDQHNT